MTDQEIQHTLEELAQEKEEDAAKEVENNAAMAQGEEDVSQAGSDLDMDREQQGKDADAMRDEGGKQADHDRAKELQKENINVKVTETLTKLKKKILNESGDKGKKLVSLDRILSRNTRNTQRKG